MKLINIDILQFLKGILYSSDGITINLDGGKGAEKKKYSVMEFETQVLKPGYKINKAVYGGFGDYYFGYNDYDDLQLGGTQLCVVVVGVYTFPMFAFF